MYCGAKRMRTRVTLPGGATKVSFHPLSCGDGGSGGPIRKSWACQSAVEIHGVFDVGPHRWVIERQRRAVQALPVRLEALDIDVLPILQLELHEVDVDRMGVLGEILEVPRLGGADLRHLGDG